MIGSTGHRLFMGWQISSPRIGWLRMTSHSSLREQSLLEENRVGNTDFADVVQIAAAIKRGQIGMREAQCFAQHHRRHRQTLAMLPGIDVALLHRLRQRKQNGFGLFQANRSAPCCAAWRGCAFAPPPDATA